VTRFGRLCAVSPHPDPVASDWRMEVGRFRAREPRRVFPLAVHVGSPGGPRVQVEVPWPVPVSYDAGLRFDLVSALLERWEGNPGGHAFGWLTRPGVPELHDRDLEWHSDTGRAFGGHGLELLGFRAVTRTGWVDVRSGERQVWRRLRL
jgi:hypothetical protein